MRLEKEALIIEYIESLKGHWVTTCWKVVYFYGDYICCMKSMSHMTCQQLEEFTFMPFTHVHGNITSSSLTISNFKFQNSKYLVIGFVGSYAWERDECEDWCIWNPFARWDGCVQITLGKKGIVLYTIEYSSNFAWIWLFLM